MLVRIGLLFSRGTFYLAVLTLLISAMPAVAQVVLSEIMYDPATSESHDEFVEIYNLSGSQSVDLAGWVVGDSLELDEIVDAGQGLLLGPGQYAVILDGSYLGNSTTYDELIPAEALIVKISDAVFGSGGLSNSKREPVILISAQGDTVGRYRYTLGNSPGFSEEKIDLTGGDSSENWTDSEVQGGTPGCRNSVSRFEYDLALVALRISPSRPRRGDATGLSAVVVNLGSRAVEAFDLRFYLDVNEDSVAAPDELLGAPIGHSGLASGDTTVLSLNWQDLPPGVHTILARVSYQVDEKPANNQVISVLHVGSLKGDLLINEVMYRPGAGEPEWVELFNPRDEPVDLRMWGLSDSREDQAVILTGESAVVEPQGYATLAEDSLIWALFPDLSGLVLIAPKGWPALNNSGDAVILWDAAGYAVDSLVYSPQWGGEAGVSLERIRSEWSTNSARNWDSCQESLGGTPNAANSIRPRDWDIGLSPHGILFNPTLPQMGERIEVSIWVHNRGLNVAEDLDVTFFNDVNLDSVVSSDEAIFPTCELNSLASTDSAKCTTFLDIARSGLVHMFARLSFALDEDTTDNWAVGEIPVPFETGDLVINEIMFRPASGAPEWVELYNPTAKYVDVFRWRLSDENVETKRQVTASHVFVPPNGFLLVAEDSTVLSQNPDISCPVLTLGPGWPTLNNDEDAVVVWDLTEGMIDSVSYFSHWGGSRGISLERIRHEWASTDSSNWNACTDPLGATPGRLNSATPRVVDVAVVGDSVSFEPNKPTVGQTVTVRVLVQNVGRQEVVGAHVQLFWDVDRDSVLADDEKLGDPLAVGVLGEGSSGVVSVQWLEPPSGVLQIGVCVDCVGDEKPENNVAFVELVVGFQRGLVIVNEIMYSPLTDEPEWVELCNRSEEVVDLQRWQISDADTGNLRTITDQTTRLQPETFAVLSEDSSVFSFFGYFEVPFFEVAGWPSLSSDEDAVVLYDPNGNVIDSVAYDSDWGGGKGISLERINPNLSSSASGNWSSCVEVLGGTPGRSNSIYTRTLPSSTSLSVSPSPFSPDGDGHEDFAIVSYRLAVSTAAVNIKIYDVAGRLIRFLYNNQPSGSEGSVPWDGSDDRGQRARIGVYIVYLEALNALAGILEKARTTVVVAGRL